MSIDPKDAKFTPDENIALTCKTTLRLPNNNTKRKNNKHHHLFQRNHKPTISWYKENELIKEEITSNNNQNNTNSIKKHEIHTTHERMSHFLTSTLLIHDAKVEDSGKYRCIYENIQEQAVVTVSSPSKN